MTKSIDIFCEIPCLTERSTLLDGIVLQKKWFRSADKRIIGQYLQKFIVYNSKYFNFLGVEPLIVGSDQSVSIVFRTSGFVGAIPLRAPDTGKQIGDFVVKPRFSGHDRYEEYIEILNLLGKEISPEIVDSLPLASGANFRPPLYLEATKFISSLEKLIKSNWRKFDNIKSYSDAPIGRVNWSKYFNESFKVENRQKFPIKKNVLSEFHSEYSEIRYVFDICKRELLSSNTPLRIKSTIRSRLEFLEEKLYNHKPKKTTNVILKFADNPVIINCKEQANRILHHNLLNSTAWRVDYSDVFEKFIQYVFKQVAKKTGGKLYSNYKFHSRTNKYYAWELKHIEPDAIYQKDNLLIFIDAKYKSHLYNKFGKSEQLKDDHRHDLHQIMAYSSFSNTSSKFGFLFYPSNNYETKKITFRNGINDTTNEIRLIGIPLKKDSIFQVVNFIISEIDLLERNLISSSS